MNQDYNQLKDKENDMNQLPRLSYRQKVYHYMVTSLADGGRKNLDEDAPTNKLRLALFNFFRRRNWNEAKRLRNKYGNTTYRR